VQSVPQAIPAGDEVTAPVPVPAFVTVRVAVVEDVVVGVSPPPPPPPPPPHPVKVNTKMAIGRKRCKIPVLNSLLSVFKRHPPIYFRHKGPKKLNYYAFVLVPFSLLSKLPPGKEHLPLLICDFPTLVGLLQDDHVLYGSNHALDVLKLGPLRPGWHVN